MLMAYQATSRLGYRVFHGIAGFGRFVLFALQTARWILTSPGQWCRWRQLRPQFYTVGVASIPVVAITGGFIGMILAMEIHRPGLRLEGGWVDHQRSASRSARSCRRQRRPGGALAPNPPQHRTTGRHAAMASDPIPVVPRVVFYVIMTPILTIYRSPGRLGTPITVGSTAFHHRLLEFTEYFLGCGTGQRTDRRLLRRASASSPATRASTADRAPPASGGPPPMPSWSVSSPSS